MFLHFRVKALPCLRVRKRQWGKALCIQARLYGILTVVLKKGLIIEEQLTVIKYNQTTSELKPKIITILKKDKLKDYTLSLS